MTQILVVDDNPDNLYYLESLLSARGYDVVKAGHGAEALTKARATPPDLIVCDLLMPVMDGYTLLRHWKADERLAHVPFVVYTATYTDPGDEALALELGADAFILKPSEPEDFLDEIRRTLSGGTRQRQGPGQEVGGEGAEADLLREYSHTLIRKLEDKSMELAESNRRLQEDIRAREDVERALRESEQRFRQLAESIEDVFWLTDAESGALIYLSPAFEAITGRPCSELTADPGAWSELVHPADLDRVQASLARYGTPDWDETFRIVHSDGSIRWVRCRSYPVHGPGRDAYRVAGVARDVTQYRRLEEQFRQAHKMEAIGRLAGGVAHDFNNILSVVLTYAALAQAATPEGSGLSDDLEQIAQAGRRAADLTRQLLAFSRQQVLDPRVLDVGAVVENARKMLKRLLGEDVSLVLLVGDGPFRIRADRGQLEQVIMNLAVNARDAMPRGGALTVQVGLTELEADEVPELPPGQHVVLTVSDTGEGMEEAIVGKIFEPFFTTKDKERGTGLGLSTVFGIVKQSGGHIAVDSIPGAGTTFRLWFPATDRPVDETRPVEVSQRDLRGTETVLLIEDDEPVREILRLVLERAGYTVLDARNGGEALLVSEEFDAEIELLVTDVVMPRVSGPVIARRLLKRRPDMRVLFVSGYADDKLEQHDVHRLGAALLSKPVTPDTLLSAVRAVLDAE